MTGIYQCRDIVLLGRFNLGTIGPRKFVRDTTFRDVPSPHRLSDADSGDLDVSDLNSEVVYSPHTLYARTKLLNILMTR
jgi:hypothetical protein